MIRVASGAVASVAAVHRLLTQRGPDERDYLIATYAGATVVEFSTVGVNGKSADETAIANATDWSEHHDGEFVVYFVPGRGHRNVALAAAHAGVGRYLVNADSASADSMHGTQLDPEALEHWRSLAATRRGLDSPWDAVA